VITVVCYARLDTVFLNHRNNFVCDFQRRLARTFHPIIAIRRLCVALIVFCHFLEHVEDFNGMEY